MKHNTVEEAAGDLLRLYEEEFHGPFPYADCRKLRREGDNYEGLIPELDMYFSNIAGYCSWGKRILKWPDEKINEAKKVLKKSFFEKHPQYESLRPLITAANTPDLYARLVLCDRLRDGLLELLSQLGTREQT